MILTDDLILNYKRCERRSFLNVYGNPLEKEPEKDFLIKLRQETKNLINQILSLYYPIYYKPTFPDSDWKTQAQQTEILMQQGVDCIAKGALVNYQQKITFLGFPDLLIKQPGKSNFGDWSYIPISVKLGHKAKPEYKLVGTFYALLLNNIQGVLPKRIDIILRQHNVYQVNLDLWFIKLQETLLELAKMLSEQQEPEVFISRQRCNLCHWYNHCYTIAQRDKHLSLVPGVTPSRYEYLQTIGINSLESLANTSLPHLSQDLELEIATNLQQQAQSIVENKPKLKIPFYLPTAPIELYFDIEAEPEKNLDYLLGVFIVNYSKNTQRFYPFLAQQPEEESIIWQQFLNLVNLYPQAPIFHYSGYEVETIKRLAKLYQSSPQQLESLLSRCVDLHHHLTNCVILPVESYSLKSVANWLGFQWRDQGVGGDQCVFWYDQWLRTSDYSFIQAIVRYNEDDCRATFHLKDWLIKFISS